MQTQEHVVQSSLESSIDKGPYVNLLEDGMVAAVTNEDTNIHHSLVNKSETEHTNRVTKMLQDECHSAITNTSSSEDNTTHSQSCVRSQEQREEISTDKI
jgi:hypothetical protein